MNSQKIQDSVNRVVSQFGPGLIATDIWGTDGLAIAGHNQQPAAVAVFQELGQGIRSTLARSGFPSLRNYYLLDMEDNKLVLILMVGELTWGMLLDSSKVNLGLIFSVGVQEGLQNLHEAQK